MKILMRGNERHAAIAVLIRMAGVTSEKKIKAIHAYYIDGIAKRQLADIYRVDQSSLNKAILLIEQTAKNIDEFNLAR